MAIAPELMYPATTFGRGGLATKHGLRGDGTAKGEGFFGPITLNNGGVTSEYSVGVQIDGKEMDVPTLVPTLTREELDMMVNDIIPNEKKLPHAIVQKAAQHARERLRAGKSPFAGEDDQLSPRMRATPVSVSRPSGK